MAKEDKIIEVNENSLLMAFLIQNLKDRSRDNIKSLLRNKQIWVNSKPVSQFNYALKPGDKVMIKWARLSDVPSNRYLNIVFEDDYIIVIDKKAGLLSVSDGNENITAFDVVTEWVKKQNPENRVYIVHRLDQYTSGLLMFVKTDEVQNLFRNDWKTYIKERSYTAVVVGHPKNPEGKISSYLTENNAYMMLSSQDASKGKLAVTRYKTLKSNNDYTLLQVNLDTGRKNQIRVHMKDIGHPVAGDRKYGATVNPIGRLCLHATVLAFAHPVTGEILRFESKVPSDFLRLF